MNKAIKILLGVVAALVALVIIGVVLVAVFFDANAYRGQIISKVEQETGRTMTLGAIHLSLFPTLGLKLDNATLGNAAGFGDTPIATIGQADVGVRLLPLLFEHKLEVEAVYLSGVKLDLERNAHGQSNWQGLVQRQTPAKPAAEKAAKSSGPTLEGVEIGSINISGASIAYRDAQQHRNFQLQDFSLSVGALGSNEPSAFRTQFKTTSTQPAVAAEVQASGRLTLDVAAQRYAVQNLSVQVNAEGKAVPGGQQQVKLAGDVVYDGNAGTLRLADGRLGAAGVAVHASLDVSGIGGRQLHFKGPLRIDPFSPRDTLESLGLNAYRPRDAGVLKTASLKAQVSGTADSATLSDLVLKLDQSTAQGSLALSSLQTPAARFDLKLDTLDADRYLPVASAAPPDSAAARTTASGAEAPLPVAALDRITATGTLAIGKFILHGVKMSDVKLRIDARKGATKVVDLDAGLYGGSVSSSTGITVASRPRYTEKLALKGVDLGPLLHDATGKDVLSGRGTVGAQLNSSGDTIAAIRRALDGHVSLSLANGELKGFDLGRIVRQAAALLDSGGEVSAALATPSQKTDLTAVSVSGRIKNGVLSSNDLKGASPLLRLAGEGTVNLVDDTVDYTLKPTLVNTATGQGGKTMSELRGITIPVRVSGPFTKIKLRPDLGEALKSRARQEIHKQLEKHKSDIEKGRKHLREQLDKSLQKGLKGLFGGD